MIDTLPIHHHSRVLFLLNKSEIVAFPTGTSYGLGVNALDKVALEKLAELKGRTGEKAYSILLPTKDKNKFVDITEQEIKVLEKFNDKPLTLLVKPQAILAHLAKDGRIGVRTADHPFTKGLVDLLEFPITATSANHTGENPAYSTDELTKMFTKETFMAVDGGKLPVNAPSTVAKFEDGKWIILREGSIKKKELEAI
ncbi:MAG: L-threonylcarbamoyladenylate synthase [bacterium]|nr:L-threonylcarbamoyladenylate synthase [bacterium]